MEFAQRLETKDLILGKAKQEDLESIYKNYWSSEWSARYMLWTPQKNLEEAQDRLNRTFNFQKDHMAFFVYEKSTGQAIGQAGMVEIEPGIYEDGGIGIGPDFVGKGYGKQILRCLIDYIFTQTNAKKFVCSCFKPNVASAKMQQACGLKYEYSKEVTRERDGAIFIADYYTQTKEDWLKNQTTEK